VPCAMCLCTCGLTYAQVTGLATKRGETALRLAARL
jgi:hypothetical protein